MFKEPASSSDPIFVASPSSIKPIGESDEPNIDERSSHPSSQDRFPITSLRSHRWQPQILRLHVTLVVVLVLLGIVAGLESFLRISHARSGFTVPRRGALEVIIYGPVVAFVAMGLVWRTWELEVKKLAPWTDMRRRPTPAKDSILLDYVGANYVEVIYRAIRHKHWPVLLAILGSLMLSLCNIAATSLWSVSPQTFTVPLVVRQTSKLGGGFNSGSTSYLSSYFGHYLYNVPTPSWQYGSIAMSPFEADDVDNSSGMISTVTEGYSGTLNCERVDAHLDGASYIVSDISLAVVQPLNLSWRGCEVLINVTNYFYDEPVLLGLVDDVICNSLHVSIVGIFNYTRPAELTDMTVVACQHLYLRSEVAVTVNSSTLTVQGTPVILSSEPTTLPDGDKLLYWLYSSNMDTGSSKAAYDRNQNEFSNPWTWPRAVLADPTNQDVAIKLGTWINLVGRVRNITKTDFLSHERLGNLSRDVFEQIFPYIALDAYAEPSTQRMNGTRTVVEQRLVVKELSIRLVQSALCVLAAIALTLYFLRPVTHLSGDPDSIIASATILAASHGLAAYLASTSAAREHEFDARLRYTTCYTRPGHGRAAAILYASESDRETNGPCISLDDSRSGQAPFWQPFMLSLPAKAIMLGYITVCIVGLELALQRSERDGGLVDIATQNTLSQHGIPYLAPAVLFVLGLVLASFDFAIRVTEPFRCLAAAPQSAGALGFNPTFAGEYAAVSRAIRRREFTVVLAASTSVLTLICKIAVAGLIFNGTKDGSVPLDLKLQSQFNSTYNSTLEFGLWQYVRNPQYALSRPGFTTQSYAVASAELPATDSSTAGVTVRLPVTHASLGHCQRVQTALGDARSVAAYIWVLTFNFSNYEPCAGSRYLWGVSTVPEARSLATVQDLAATGCGEHMHFFVVHWPGQDPLTMGSPPPSITHLACDWDLTLSSMDVTLLAVGAVPQILHIDTDSERNITRIPFVHRDIWGTNSVSPNYTTNPLPDTYTDPFFTGLLAAQLGTATDITAYLDPDYLESVIRSGWSDFWAIQFDQKLRIQTSSQIPATRRYTVTRTKLAVVPARILEGLLGAILLIVAVVCALTSSRSVLLKPPFSIAAQMSLVVGTRLLKRIEEGGSLEGLRVKLGWWRDPSVEGWRRYGIDIVEDEEQIPLYVFGERL